ncbi:hypothetical protein FEM48_Zijuj02G0169900 [Ziziphus jujuba var. spinosa]|uniref:Uncharacterized protein n=1 Tax=Ziziphus jujuba var. spinosa TaxID=714518 RepID=A0A978VWV7_ZIZJJ|nr:hypothetical protein FEM48_Zijuj02G0169900 [Ziziphus jujuba var. spinosa]
MVDLFVLDKTIHAAYVSFKDPNQFYVFSSKLEVVPNRSDYPFLLMQKLLTPFEMRGYQGVYTWRSRCIL